MLKHVLQCAFFLFSVNLVHLKTWNRHYLLAEYDRRPFRAPLLLRLKYSRQKNFLIRNTDSVRNSKWSIISKIRTDMSIFVWFISLCLVQFCVAARGPSTPHPTYESRYDYLDIDKILANDRLLKRIMDCINDRVPCTREGKDLKRE